MHRYTIEFDPAGDPERPYRLLRDGEEIGRYADAATAGSVILGEQGGASEADAAPTGKEFFGVLCVEGVDTGNPDNRYLEPGMGEARPVPLALFAQSIIPESGGHALANLAGRIDSVTRMSDGRRMFMHGVFDASPDGEEACRMCEAQVLRFVSADLAPPIEVTRQVLEVDDDGWPSRTLVRFGPYTIGGATMVGHPAIPQAVIWADGMDVPEEVFADLPELVDAAYVPPGYDPSAVDDFWRSEVQALIASTRRSPAETLEQILEQINVDRGEVRNVHPVSLTAAGALAPPREWFTDPQLAEPTPLAIDDDGHIYGHILTWKQRHLGFPDRKVFAPHSRRGYALFHSKHNGVKCSDGSFVDTGRVTLGGEHANSDPRRGPVDIVAAQRHYDDASMAIADVCAGEDRFGVWINGNIRPGTTDEQVYALRASPPSGDWREWEGGLELLIVHSVNMPGFPVARVASARGECPECPDRVLALIAGFSGGPGDAEEAETPAEAPSEAADAPPAAEAPSTDAPAAAASDCEPGPPPTDATGLAERVAAMERAMDPLLPLAAERATHGLGFEERAAEAAAAEAEEARIAGLSPLERIAARGLASKPG